MSCRSCDHPRVYHDRYGRCLTLGCSCAEYREPAQATEGQLALDADLDDEGTPIPDHYNELPEGY